MKGDTMTSERDQAATEELVDRFLSLCNDKPSWMILVAVGEVLGRVLASSPDEKLVADTLEHFAQSVRDVRLAHLPASGSES